MSVRECRGCVRTMLDPALFIAASANWRYTTVSAPRRLVHRVGNKMPFRRCSAPLSLCLLFSHSSAASAPIYWSITIPIRIRTGRQTRFITGIAIADSQERYKTRVSERVASFAVSAAPSASICTFYKPHGLCITQCLMCVGLVL